MEVLELWRGAHVKLWWFGCYELALKLVGNESVNHESLSALRLCFFAHQVFDILPHWVMRLDLIVYSCLFNSKLDFVRYIISFRTLKVIWWCYSWSLYDVICIDITNTWVSVALEHGCFVVNAWEFIKIVILAWFY